MATVNLTFNDGNTAVAEAELDSGGQLLDLTIAGNYTPRDVVEIELPPEIKRVDQQIASLFKNLKTLRALGLEEVSKYAWSELNQLHLVDAPEAKVIRSHAFYKCTRLKDVRCPKVKIIQSYAFAHAGLESFEGAAVESIRTFAFAWCQSLTSVKCLKAKKTGGFVFSECTKLENVEFPMMEQLVVGEFSNCVNLERIRLDRVKNIGSESFAGCQSLVTISLGMIETIESYAFRECFALRSLTNLPAHFRPTKQDIIDAFDEEGPPTLVLVYKVPGSTVGKAYEILLRPDAEPRLKGRKFDQLAVSLPKEKAKQAGNELQALELLKRLEIKPRGVKGNTAYSLEDILAKMQRQTIDSYGGFTPFNLERVDFVENPPKRPAEAAGGPAPQRQRRE